jgi:hypothetical protein
MDPGQFWAAFAVEAQSLRELVLTRRIRLAYERIGKLLNKAGYSRVYEVTSTADEQCVLIFTPESDPVLAAVVDSFVAAAPRIDGWLVYNRRQRRPVEDAIATVEQVYGVSLRDLRLAVSPDDGGLAVTMHTGLADILGEPEKAGFIAFFLEHSLGEAFVMSKVRRMSIAPLPAPQGGMSPQQFVDAIFPKE